MATAGAGPCGGVVRGGAGSAKRRRARSAGSAPIRFWIGGWEREGEWWGLRNEAEGAIG